MAKREFLDELSRLEELMRLVANNKSGDQFVAVNFSRADGLKFARAIKKIRRKLIDVALSKQ
jgi:hypothetical protein